MLHITEILNFSINSSLCNSYKYGHLRCELDFINKYLQAKIYTEGIAEN